MAKTCSINGCTALYCAKGFCEKHWRRIKTHGTPLDQKGQHVPIKIKFYQRIDKNGSSVTPTGTPCWLWTGGMSPSGYGMVWWNGRNERAHRIAWIMAHGPIPSGKIVLHRCDTPLCVNVEHLRLGTQKENIEDCIKRGRRGRTGAPGEKHGRAKLTDNDIRAIRTDPRSHIPVAVDYNVHPSTICDIRNRKTWSHIV